MDVVSRMCAESKIHEEVQDGSDVRDTAASDEVGAVALCCEVDAGIGGGYEWSEELYAEGDEILYYEPGFVD